MCYNFDIMYSTGNQKDNIVKLYLFGSIQRNEQNNESDIDIIVTGTDIELENFIEDFDSYLTDNGGKLDVFFPDQEYGLISPMNGRTIPLECVDVRGIDLQGLKNLLLV